MKSLNIIIITGVIYPQISPRSFRSTELARGLAKLRHNVTINAILGRYDYSGFEKYNKIKVRDLGESYFCNIDSDRIAYRSFLDKVLIDYCIM